MMFLQSFKKAFQSVFKYKGLLVIFLLGPLFLTLLFGGVYSNDYVNDIPIAILDEDSSTLSHYVSDAFIKNDRFDVVTYPNSLKEMQKLIDDGSIAMCIWIPDHFESNINHFKSAEISAIIDGSNNVVAGNAYAQATTIIQTISAGVEMKLISAKGLTNASAENIALVYNVGERILFDSKMTYMNYLMICFFAVFIQQLMMSALGVLLNRDRESLLKGNVIINILSTLAVCMISITPSLLVSVLLLKKLFHIPMIGNLWLAAFMTILFMISLLGPAMTLAGLTRDRVKYAQFSFMLSVPTFVTSGSVWPLEQMPQVLKVIVKIVWPLVYYAKPLQEVIIKNRSFYSTVPQLIGLITYAIIWMLIGYAIYNKESHLKKRIYQII